jgi:Rieske Fe-S protein
MTTTVTRRSALTASAVVVAGAVTGFVYGHANGAATSTASGSSYRRMSTVRTLLARLAAIPVGGGLITSGVVVTRPSGHAVHAFSSRCTHLGCTVNQVANGRIFCPCHGSVFDASTGAVLQGPATAPLPRVRITVENGGVYAS